MGTSLMCFRAGFQILFGVEGKVIIFTAFIFYAYIAHPFRTALLRCNITMFSMFCCLFQLFLGKPFCQFGIVQFFFRIFHTSIKATEFIWQSTSSPWLSTKQKEWDFPTFRVTVFSIMYWMGFGLCVIVMGSWGVKPGSFATSAMFSVNSMRFPQSISLAIRELSSLHPSYQKTTGLFYDYQNP